MSPYALFKTRSRVSLAQAVKNVEDRLDNTLQALDNLDPDDIENMRQRRLEQMKRAAAQKQEWSRRGHGEYNEISGERGFFKEMKGEERMVCHFFRENWPCKVSACILLAAQSRKLPYDFPWAPSWRRCTLCQEKQASSSMQRHTQLPQLAPMCVAPMAHMCMHMTKLMYDQSTGNAGHG